MYADVRSLSSSVASSVAFVRYAMLDGTPSNTEDSFGESADHAVAARIASSAAIALSGVRRASKVAQLLTSDGVADLDPGMVNARAAWQKTTRWA